VYFFSADFTLQNMNSSSSKRISPWPVALLLVYLVFTGIWLDRYPRVWVDEGWIAEVAAQAAVGLPPGSPSHGALHRYEDRLFWMPPLFFYDLVPGRAFSVALGALATLALFFVLRRRTGSPAAFWAALFFASDTFVWKIHRTIRFESLLVLFAVLLFAAVLRALERDEERAPSRGLWLAAGLLAGLAANVHPNGVLLAFAAAAAAFVRRGPALAAASGPWVGLVAALLLVVPYALYVLTDAASGFANVAGQNSFHLEHGGGALSAPLREWRRWADWFDGPARLPHLAAWLALIGLAVIARRDPVRRATLVFLAALTLGLACLPNKTLLYAGLLAPFVAILGALAWSGGSRLARVALVGGVAAALITNGALLVRDAGCRPADDFARIGSALRPDDRVAGTFVTWWAARERPFLEFSRAATIERVAAFRPTVLLLGDRQWTQEAAGRFAPLEAALFAPGGPLAGSMPLLELSESCLGPVRLYRVETWPGASDSAGADSAAPGSSVPGASPPAPGAAGPTGF
jgi:hypothetical protein